MRTHTGEKPYKCEREYSASQIGNLKLHALTLVKTMQHAVSDPVTTVAFDPSHVFNSDSSPILDFSLISVFSSDSGNCCCFDPSHVVNSDSSPILDFSLISFSVLIPVTTVAFDPSHVFLIL
ncbi:hypothetical protein EVAR_99515_1 [Eumeta japonica]|uniref:Uncharacterized protein n=1 Tax=Eumeta variegata TaxID=151549 RepID=A0A4C1SD86_EUMVA|nr:hypothetical protein EVAR_99515_1 [Eumeta japonica]